MATSKDLDAVFLISDEHIRKIARARACQNNGYARLVGQLAELKASWLIDLYYRQKGRCAISGFPLEYHERMMHPRSIELDHIVECRRRQQLSAVIAGASADGGQIAHIDNVQWVCRFANVMKQHAKQQGVSLTDLCRAIADQGDSGYPLRAEASFLGFEGRAEYRRGVILGCIKNNPVCPVSLVMQQLAGTPGEASHGVVREQMQELGWTDSRPNYVQIRRDAISAVIESNGPHWDCQADFQNAVRQELASRGVDKNPAVCWLKKQAKSMGITLVFGASLRSVCSGDKSRALLLLKRLGAEGVCMGQFIEMLKREGIPAGIADSVVDCLVEFGAMYRREATDKIVASMTRDEAAAKIGVSVNRLKKWATHAWDGKDAGPPFMKHKSKSLTFYRHEDVEQFIASRGRHLFDLSIAGRRDACVSGGGLGGRPPMAVGSF